MNCLGIDFGTCNTIVSFKNRMGQIIPFENDFGDYVTPTIIYYNSKNDYIIGNEAKNMMVYNPLGIVKDFKNKLTSSGSIKIVAGDGSTIRKTYKSVAIDFFNVLIKNVSEELKYVCTGEDRAIDKVLVTVPAKFDEALKTSIKEIIETVVAIDKSNVSVLCEPTAAAIGYAYLQNFPSSRDNYSILVYDFGGGTFDVSLLNYNVSNNYYSELVAPSGDANLGGNTLTNVIVQNILDSIEDDFNFKLPINEQNFNENIGITLEQYRRNINQIFDKAEYIKTLASKQDINARFDMTIYNLFLPNGRVEQLNLAFDRPFIELLLKDYIVKTVQMTTELVNRSRLKSIDRVVLAGGSSKIIMIKNLLEQSLNTKINIAPNVETLISTGACYALENNVSTLSKTNFELGIEVRNHTFNPIISSGVDLPTQSTQEFTLIRDNQTNIKIRVYQRDPLKHSNISSVYNDAITYIDEFSIQLPDNLLIANTIILVTFKLNNEGLLNVSAIVKNSQTGEDITIQDINVERKSNIM